MNKKTEEDIYYFEKETINLSKIDSKGIILDIGGGGEGIIGKLNGKNVISIDKLKEELEETINNSIKIVMDASELKFLDNSIDIVTSFFSFMYIRKIDLNKVFSEIYRVLKNDGKLLIWDINIKEDYGNKKIIIIPVDIKINRKTIHVDYGVNWKNNSQNKEFFIKNAIEAGFKLNKNNSKDERIELEFIK